MFVRWQSRRRRRSVFGNGTGDVNWKAVLVESARVKGGPAYRHISYLGSIAESAIEIPAQRRFFWSHVLKRLDDLGSGPSPEDRQRIMAALARKVAGPPTPAECEQLDREFERTMGRLKSAINGTGAKPRCCFCERDTSEVRKMITGPKPGAAICDQCIELAQRALADSHSKA
jgi:hypothetical protein